MMCFKKFFLSFFLISSFLKLSFCLYKDIEEIKTISNAKEFEEILNSKKICVVQFYATWCRISRGFANDFINIAKTLKDDLTFIAIKDENLSNDYKIESYPSIKLFFVKDNKKQVENFVGDYKIKDVVSFIYDSIKNYRLKELNVDTRKNKSSYKKKNQYKNDGKVIILNDNNFDKNVLKNDDNVWFIFFYAPWCGHSKPIHPMFDDLAKIVAHLKNAKIAKIDATVEQQTAQTYRIAHYPSFRLFPAGNKNYNSAIDYKGSRNTENMYEFFLKYYIEKKEIIQLSSKQVFDEYCEKGVCLIAFLPNKEDTEISYFKSYINILNNVLKDVNNLPVTLLWTQAGDQLDIVQKLNLTFGFPIVIALSLSKNVYSILKGNFSEQSIKNFITQMMMGKALVETLIPFTIKDAPNFVFNSTDNINIEL